MGYFHEVNAKTPTRFWINNPTMAEARLAIEAGAAGCTTNPGFSAKMLSAPEEAAAPRDLIQKAIRAAPADEDAAGLVQRGLVKRLAERFMPLYAASGGSEGFVTIQSDPLRETDPAFIIAEGREARKLSPNVMVKIPVTPAGIAAIETLVREDCPVMATEVMAISQALRACEAYRAAAEESGRRPPFYVTHITGILDDYFKDLAKRRGLTIPAEILGQAGLSIAKKQYALHKRGAYPGRMIGGGARKLADFTEFVGGDLSITINWKGTAEELIKAAPPVVSRIDLPVEDRVVERLKAELPDYRRAWEETGMREEEFFEYGGVEWFRGAFIKGWNTLTAAVAAERQALKPESLN